MFVCFLCLGICLDFEPQDQVWFEIWLKKKQNKKTGIFWQDKENVKGRARAVWSMAYKSV